MTKAQKITVMLLALLCLGAGVAISESDTLTTGIEHIFERGEADI